MVEEGAAPSRALRAQAGLIQQEPLRDVVPGETKILLRLPPHLDDRAGLWVEQVARGCNRVGFIDGVEAEQGCDLRRAGAGYTQDDSVAGLAEHLLKDLPDALKGLPLNRPPAQRLDSTPAQQHGLHRVGPDVDPQPHGRVACLTIGAWVAG